MSATKIQSTRNYRLFTRHSNENRPVDMKKHKKLVESMKLYGFLECFPIVVYRDEKGNLVVKDGQHRLEGAEILNLPVHYIVEQTDFDVAVVNSTAEVWVLRDYAEKFAANGIVDYKEGLLFAEEFSIPLGMAFALLSGTTSFSNCRSEFVSGKWRIKDNGWAYAVASVYSPFVSMSRELRNARFIEAVMSVCRVDGFDRDRLLHNSKRCLHLIKSYGNKEEYIEMIESIYNYGRREMVALKMHALMAMRKRAPIVRKAG